MLTPLRGCIISVQTPWTVASTTGVSSNASFNTHNIGKVFSVSVTQVKRSIHMKLVDYFNEYMISLMKVLGGSTKSIPVCLKFRSPVS